MTTPAIAIKNDIRDLINQQIELFGQPAPLTPSELEDCHCRAERIKRTANQAEWSPSKRLPSSSRLWKNSILFNVPIHGRPADLV